MAYHSETYALPMSHLSFCKHCNFSSLHTIWNICGADFGSIFWDFGWSEGGPGGSWSTFLGSPVEIQQKRAMSQNPSLFSALLGGQHRLQKLYLCCKTRSRALWGGSRRFFFRVKNWVQHRRLLRSIFHRFWNDFGSPREGQNVVFVKAIMKFDFRLS